MRNDDLVAVAKRVAHLMETQPMKRLTREVLATYANALRIAISRSR